MTFSLLETYHIRTDSGDLQRDRGQEQVLARLQPIIDRLKKQLGQRRGFWFMRRKSDPVRGLYIWGDVGRGKTMMMDIFFTGAQHAGIPAKRVHFHEFMQDTHEFMHEERQELAAKTPERDGLLSRWAQKLAAETRLLCFDEFHVTDITDAMILGRLFQALFDEGITIVSTSNWEPERLYEGGLQRERFLPFIDILKDHMDVMPLGGEQDYRMLGEGARQHYLQPLSPATRSRFERIFKDLTSGHKAHAESLSVKSRTLQVDKAAAGVAWLTFAELCERPVGAADYLAIARNYHTVMLAGVPVMNYDRRNEAKRFMTLIDALYEAETTLYILADAPADTIYRGKDHEFEFARTVSRLVEMTG